MFVVGQDSEVSVAWTRECDYIPRECDYILRCVEHVTGVEVGGPRYLGGCIVWTQEGVYFPSASNTSPRLRSGGRGAVCT